MFRYLKVRKGGEGDGAEGITDEVEESGTEGNETTIGSQAVADGWPKHGAGEDDKYLFGGGGVTELYRTCRAP
jgi:hypothetical protein